MSIQCYNCSKFGHHAANCSNRLVCPNCSEEHILKNCPNRRNKDATKFSNCGLDHYGCSRSCSVMSEQINSRLNKISPIHIEMASAKSRNSQALNEWGKPNDFPTLNPFGDKNLEIVLK